MFKKSLVLAVVCGVLPGMLMWAQNGPAGASGVQQQQRTPRAPKPGVSTPGVRREMTSITPDAIYMVPGNPDWQVSTEDAQWVTSSSTNTVSRMDPKSDKVIAVTVGQSPCSGLAAGFGSVWVPNCGKRDPATRQTDPATKSVSRIDTKTNTVVATIPVGPVQGEGGIAASPEAVWLVTDAKGVLSRIDPKTNTVTAEVTVPEGSAGVTYGEGFVWVTSPTANMLTAVDPKTNKVVYSVPVGPGPRFCTTGAGSAWTLNQGDGTLSRVDAKTGKLIVNIQLGLPGTGGELAFGAGHVWATASQIPITEVDPATNAVIRQWFGQGGDSIRVAHGFVFLSNLSLHTVWRFSPDQP